mmetsp:Transcript_25878/g.58313  ORF Transcript_25878/g.58313 Transcript_25878/m.58313 type:complete len:220 (-) Transcript_25878:456-1115(-)
MNLSCEALAHDCLKKCLYTVCTVWTTSFLSWGVTGLPRLLVHKDEVICLLAMLQGLVHRNSVKEEKIVLAVRLNRAEGRSLRTILDAPRALAPGCLLVASFRVCRFLLLQHHVRRLPCRRVETRSILLAEGGGATYGLLPGLLVGGNPFHCKKAKLQRLQRVHRLFDLLVELHDSDMPHVICHLLDRTKAAQLGRVGGTIRGRWKHAREPRRFGQAEIA